jgi:hypothetical protein
MKRKIEKQLITETPVPTKERSPKLTIAECCRGESVATGVCDWMLTYVISN